MASKLLRLLDTASKFALFSVSGFKDEKYIKKQTYVKTETCKLYSRVSWTFLPNFSKIDSYNFQLYRFKVGAFFWVHCFRTWAKAAVSVAMTCAAVLLVAAGLDGTDLVTPDSQDRRDDVNRDCKSDTDSSHSTLWSSAIPGPTGLSDNYHAVIIVEPLQDRSSPVTTHSWNALKEPCM